MPTGWFSPTSAFWNFSDLPLPRQPKQIANELEAEGMSYHEKYIGQRCLKLAEHGLVRNLGNGIYTLTEEGQQYLAGELHAARLSEQQES